MTKPYTPDTIDVKVAYCSLFDPGFAHKVMAHAAAEMTTGHAADFDRWLEQHDDEVRAKAQEEIKHLNDLLDEFEEERERLQNALGYLTDAFISREYLHRKGLATSTEEPKT